MRSFGIRLPILAATAWAGIGFSVFGMDLGYSETVYVTPTVATVAWPTSYVASRSYVVPTAYSFPSYIPAAYEPVTLAPTYLTTAYRVRRGLFGRLRLVERPLLASYLPTTYVSPTYYATSYRLRSYAPTVYTPTVFDYPQVWESSYRVSGASDCEPVPCDTPLTASTYRSDHYPAPSQGDSAAAQAYSVPRSSGASRSVRSEPIDDPTIPSIVDPPQAGEPAIRSSVQGSTKPATPDSTADSPPKPPVPLREKTTAPLAQPAPVEKGSVTETPKAGAASPAATKPAVPTAPSGDPVEPDLKPAPVDNTGANRRETLRPIYPITRTLRPELRNVLVGRVESDSGEPMGEVSVAVTRADNVSIRRAGMTNAFGTFAIRLTDGEWNVNVRMPSGRFYPVRSVTVSNGKIVDNQEGREVRNLIISY